MKAIRHKPTDDAVHSADRMIHGNCPSCGIVIAILNAHEVWPWVECLCGWEGSTTDFNAVRCTRKYREETGETSR